MFTRQNGIEAFFDQALARPRHRRGTGVQSLDDPAVAPPLASVGYIRLEQDPSLQQLGGGMFALLDQGFKRRAFLRAQSDDVLLE